MCIITQFSTNNMSPLHNETALKKKQNIFIILFWLLKARQCCLCVALAPVGLYTIYGSFICFKSLVATALLHSHNNQLFPCVLRKFPTHFMVALNDLIICPQISKTHFEARDSFPWRPGGVSPQERPLISDVLLGQKKGAGGMVSIKKHYRLHTEGNVL